MTFRAAGEKAVNYTNGIEYRGGDFESSKSIWDGFRRFIIEKAIKQTMIH